MLDQLGEQLLETTYQRHKVPTSIFLLVCYAFAWFVQRLHVRIWFEFAILVFAGILFDLIERRFLLWRGQRVSNLSIRLK